MHDGGLHEANFLKLDCSKLNRCPKRNISTAIKEVVKWNKYWLDGGYVRKCMDKEIEEFLDK